MGSPDDTQQAQAWQTWVTKLRPFVARRVSSAADVDDIVQDVFLRMQRSIATLRDDDRFGPWVYAIARSAIGAHRQRAARHPVVRDAEASDATTVASAEDSEVSAEEELASYVAPFIALLDSPHREALTLTELEGLTQNEAAAMIGISLSGMKSRVQRGRQRLREVIEASCIVARDARGHVVSCEARERGRLPNCRCR